MECHMVSYWDHHFYCDDKKIYVSEAITSF